jgi:hypothetical protein
MTQGLGEVTPRTSRKGDSHFYNYKATDHWAYECPQLSAKQQAQLQMNLEAQDENKEQ